MSSVLASQEGRTSSTDSEAKNERLDLADPTVAIELSVPEETLLRAAISLKDQVLPYSVANFVYFTLSLSLFFGGVMWWWLL